MTLTICGLRMTPLVLKTLRKVRATLSPSTLSWGTVGDIVTASDHEYAIHKINFMDVVIMSYFEDYKFSHSLAATRVYFILRDYPSPIEEFENEYDYWLENSDLLGYVIYDGFRKEVLDLLSYDNLTYELVRDVL